ncbi:MAG: histidine phosphatase family protein [Actinomycetota bacterium]|nr:histidine phosphatase family protein [Actinomycetota bacterium]MDI6822010.1 histidine phosphatase family protein [Actinomycetota bacterium]
MLRLFLIRHGETQWNVESKYLGSTDLGLTERGKHQTLALARRLRGESLNSIYSSSSKRALTTAQAIADIHGLEIKVLPQMNEINYGEWEGLTYDEINRDYPQFMERWAAGEEGLPPGGESLPSFKSRVSEGLQLVIENMKGKVVMVTHAGPIRVVICEILGLDFSNFWKIKQDSAALNVIDFYDGKGIISLLNDTCHLRWD